MAYRCVNGWMTLFFTTYQEFQEVTSPGLVIALFRQRSGEHLALFMQAHNKDLVYIGHFGIGWF